MVDLDDYINKLHNQIEHLKNVNQSLRMEILTQRHEIADLKDAINALSNWDKSDTVTDVKY